MDTTQTSGDGTGTTIPTIAPARAAAPGRTSRAAKKEVEAPALAYLRGEYPRDSEMDDTYKGILDIFEAHPEAPTFLTSLPDWDEGAAVVTPAQIPLQSYNGTRTRKDVQLLISSLTALLRSREFAVISTEVGNGVPDERLINPRLGLVQLSTIVRANKQKTPSGGAAGRELAPLPVGHVHYQCDLTSRFFTLPVGAPVPALVYDEDSAAPSCDYEYLYVVHPGLYSAGPRYVLAALWERLYWDTHSVFETLSTKITALTLVLGLNPEDIAPLDPARAFSVMPRTPLAEVRKMEGIGPQGFPLATPAAGWTDVDAWQAVND